MTLKVNDVTKSYDNKKILDKVSFSIEKGEFVALIGNNGVGKTTLFKILSGLINFDGGQVHLFEKPVRPLDSWHRRNLGIIFSDSFLIEDFTPKEYLKFTGKFHGLKSAEIETRTRELTQQLRIEDVFNQPIKELSTGFKKRVSIAASLIHEPTILFYDEPFLGLDFKTTDIICNTLKQLKQDKILLISSHDINLVADLCDVFLYLGEDGKLHDPINRVDFESSLDLITYLKGEKF